MSLADTSTHVNVFVNNILNSLGDDYRFSDSVLVHMNEDDGSPDFVPEIADGYDFLFVPSDTKLQVVVTDHFYEVALQKDDGSFDQTHHLDSAAEIPKAMMKIVDLEMEAQRVDQAELLTENLQNSSEILRSRKTL